LVPNYGKMMKQVQKLQQDMAKVQEELADEKVEASAGGGMVKVVVSGQQKILEVKINPEALDPSDVEMLEDMILVATSEAMQKAQDLAAQRLGPLTGGLNVPGLM
jgi:DNA-binding YbaB/EbfC family protein